MEIDPIAGFVIILVLGGIAVVIVVRSKNTKKVRPFFLYADAQPSETIHSDGVPGLAVACVLPFKEGERFLDVPVKQYKNYGKRQKADSANRLSEWLKEKREKGLIITGFLLARSLSAAAKYGLELIEELPDARVEPHYGKFRLYFDNEPINFSHAVALMYYAFVLDFAVLRASNYMRKGQRYMVIFLDRFPDARQGDLAPGMRPSKKTQGMKFLEFVRGRSKTAIEIDKENRKREIFYQLDNLLWWKKSDDSKLEEGKNHPHFTLVDWLVASARAQHFREEYIALFQAREQGVQAADAMKNLFEEFKRFDVWEVADDATLDHLRSNEKHWKVPDDARNHVLAHAAT